MIYDLRDNILYFAEEHDRDMTEDEALDIIAGYSRDEIQEVLDFIETDDIDEYDQSIQKILFGCLDTIREVLDTIDWEPPTDDWTI